jgi:hypothetical protein
LFVFDVFNWVRVSRLLKRVLGNWRGGFCDSNKGINEISDVRSQMTEIMCEMGSKRGL